MKTQPYATGISDFPDTARSQNPFPVEQRIVEVLLISPFEEDHQDLKQIVQHSKWQLHSSRSQAEALKFLEDHLTPVAICESALPDGTWKDLLPRLARLQNPPILVVTSRLADERLWSEALNLGAYNVLAKPWEAREIFHVVSFAWLYWKNQGSRASGGFAASGEQWVAAAS